MNKLFFVPLFSILILPVFGQGLDLAVEELKLEQLLIELRSAKGDQEKKSDTFRVR